MKLKFNVLIIATVLSIAAFANSPSSVIVASISNASVFTIRYKAPEVNTVKISILNSNNQLVFSETLTNVESFARPYNFRQLAEGEYTIIVADKNGKQAEKINYSMDKISSFISVTKVAKAENKYALNVNNNGTEDVFVKIYDNDQLLHEQTVQVTGSFGLIYNLSKVALTSDASVTFQISTTGGKVEIIKF